MDNLLHNAPLVAAVGDIDEDVKFSAEADSTNNKCTYTQLDSGVGHKFVYDIATGSVLVLLQ